MVARLSVCCALAGLLVLGLAAPAQAAGRGLWFHSKGSFTNTRGNDWVEHYGSETYYFREVRRTDGCVDLYDRSRDCTVRLTRHACLVRLGSGGFSRYYTGRWDRE
jgi:hypothetical protein